MGDQDPKRNKGKGKMVPEDEDMAAWDGTRNVRVSRAGAGHQSAARSAAPVVNPPLSVAPGGLQPLRPGEVGCSACRRSFDACTCWLDHGNRRLQFRENLGQNAPRSAAPVVNLPHGRPAGQLFAGGLQMQAPTPSSLQALRPRGDGCVCPLCQNSRYYPCNLCQPPPRPAALSHYQQRPQIQANYVYSRKALEWGKEMAARTARTATGPYTRERNGGTGNAGNLRFRENQKPGQKAPPLAPVVSNQPQGQASTSGQVAVRQQQYIRTGQPHGGALGVGGSSSSFNPGAGLHGLQFQPPPLGNMPLQPRGNLPSQYQRIRENSAQLQHRPVLANRPAPPAFQNLHQRPPIPIDGEVRPCPACGWELGGRMLHHPRRHVCRCEGCLFSHTCRVCPPPPGLPADYSLPFPGPDPDECRLCVACRQNPVPVPPQPPRHICVCQFCRSQGVVCSVCDFCP